MKKKIKNVLVTGSAGFVGFHLSLELIKTGCNLIGIDSLNSYYDLNLKLSRNNILKKYSNYKFYEINLDDFQSLKQIFKQYNPDYIFHLAAQAGVRNSIENPREYLNSNINGTYNLLELIRDQKIEHFLFASTSSVYGSNKKLPFNDKEFDYVICAHVIEHVNDPIFFKKEIERIGKSGYIELPTRLNDNMVFGCDEEVFGHKWWFEFDDDNKKLVFSSKIDAFEQFVSVISIVISIPLIFLFSLFILKRFRKFLNSDLDKQILGIIFDKFFGILYGIVFSYIIFSSLLFLVDGNELKFLNNFYSFLVENSNILKQISEYNNKHYKNSQNYKT